jgi:hypothetical protein
LYALDTPPVVKIASLVNVQADHTLVGSRSVVSAVNAAGTMLAGLIGCGIGVLAYRHSHDS